MEFKILFQNSDLVVIDKPAGYHVHPPEVKPEKVPRDKIVLHQLRDQIGCKVHPLHRLDAGTSGVLAFALNSDAASYYGQHFQNQKIQKKYWALVRGHFKGDGEITTPLESDSSGELVAATTIYKVLGQMELPFQIEKKHSTSRYSWLEVFPKTGRYHQIRRHMNRISHPIVGDATHGDSRHNRFFREQMQISGLCLRSIELQLPLSEVEAPLVIQAGEDFKWTKIRELFQKNSN